MKKTIVFWTLSVLIWISASLNAQTAKSTGSFIFPEQTVEFSVIFPHAPRVQTIYIEGGLSGKQAVLTTGDSFLRAEVMELSDEQAANAAKNTESQRVEIALAYARANGISNASVSAGVNDLGRFARLRGNKTIEGISVTYETMFIWGKKQAFNIAVGGMSSSYPQRSITTFLNSVKSLGQSVRSRGIGISVNPSILTIGGSVIEFPISRAEVFRVLGSPTRQTSKTNTIYTWDDIGVLAYERPNSGQINQVNVVFNNVDMNYDFFPIRVFSGILTVNGKPILQSSKSNGLNYGRTGTLFSNVEGLSFLREIQLGKLNLTAAFALDSNYNENGKLIEVTIRNQ